jgi:phage terminase large subunit-like protein
VPELSPLQTESFATWLKHQPKARQRQVVNLMTPEEQRNYYQIWDFHARANQRLPGSPKAAIQRDDWVFWLLLAGRGFGKTRTGAEAVRTWAENPTARILMIAPTSADVRETMLEGPSGLLNCYPENEKPQYNPSRHLVTFPSGAIGITRSADEPERLRGPQYTQFWADEICAWNYLDEAWAQIMFGFRLKTQRLQGVITTTPKPHNVLKEIRNDPATVVTGGSSHDNRENLSDLWYSKVIKPYEGTRLGRQEIYAEVLEDTQGALWTLKLIEAGRTAMAPQQFARIVVAIDPAVSMGENSSETGIVVVGLAWDGHVYVLADLTLKGTPHEWASVAIAAYTRWKADVIVGEVNNGGDLVEANIRSVNRNVAFRSVRASRGKLTRAEPIANLYEQGRVHHWIDPHNPAHLQDLETEMCSYVPLAKMKSPDRMDALVWGITELLIDTEEIPQSYSLVAPVRISRY